MFGFGNSKDGSAKLAALDRSQAIIEFETDGKIVTANQNFLDALGYSLGEIQGKHHSMFVEPKERDGVEYRRFWDDLRAGKFQQAEYKRIGKGGKEIWIQATTIRC
ncbi:MAG: methyl-accepting chemotaxis protein [Xanthobacteraceae bacterium]|nr:MAG: methyl-accepting chemotaxis protein [Xanthobacteraceae bacterium]